MEKTRVPKGEKYWYINDCLYISEGYERGVCISEVHFIKGNYFHTREEALQMARKFRAVLNGAEVIEMPSEEEIQKVLAEKIPIHGGRTYGEALNCCWFEEGIHWLRDNKIIK